MKKYDFEKRYKHEKEDGFYLCNNNVYSLEYFLKTICSPKDFIVEEKHESGTIYRNYDKKLVYIQEVRSIL